MKIEVGDKVTCKVTGTFSNIKFVKGLTYNVLEKNDGYVILSPNEFSHCGCHFFYEDYDLYVRNSYFETFYTPEELRSKKLNTIIDSDYLGLI